MSQSNHLVYINIVILFQFYNLGQKSGDRFPLVCPGPPPIPLTTLNACIHNFSLQGWGGELQGMVGEGNCKAFVKKIAETLLAL